MNTCETADELQNCLQPGGASAAGAAEGPDATTGKRPAKMKSIKPPIGQALGVGPLANVLCPQPRLADGALLDDAVGYAPALLIDSALHDAAAGTVAELESRAVRVVLAAGEPGVAAVLDGLGVAAVLVRPDRYILGTATAAAELTTLAEAWAAICGGDGG